MLSPKNSVAIFKMPLPITDQGELPTSNRQRLSSQLIGWSQLLITFNYIVRSPMPFHSADYKSVVCADPKSSSKAVHVPDVPINFTGNCPITVCYIFDVSKPWASISKKKNPFNYGFCFYTSHFFIIIKSWLIHHCRLKKTQHPSHFARYNFNI